VWPFRISKTAETRREHSRRRVEEAERMQTARLAKADG